MRHGAALPKTLPEAHALIASLLERRDQMERLVEKQAKRIEELERQLKQTSRNSSKPPSSDSGSPPRPPKKSSGRKPGAQTGHQGHQRKLLPLARVDHLQHVWPARCGHCSEDLGDEALRVEVGDPLRHQVAEIPPARAVVTEYQLHSQCCPGCQHTTAAELPDGAPRSAFGPRLQAVAAMLSGLYRLSKRSVKTMLSDLFDVEISLGAIVACEQRTSQALAAPVAELGDYVRAQDTVNADETSWRERRRKCWLWVAVTRSATIFMIHARRGAVAARILLGDFAGILGSDRWCAYESHKLSKRQLCWAHLKRHFEEFAQYRGAPGLIGNSLLRFTELIFACWHQARDEGWSRSKLRRRTAPLQRSLEECLRRGSVCGQKRVQGTCKQLLARVSALWTFLRVPGVEPTNNSAERALRSAVIMRKTSFGTHSEGGSRFLERMLSTVATLRQQTRSVLDYLEETCDRALLGRRPRSLLPHARIMTADAIETPGQ